MQGIVEHCGDYDGTSGKKPTPIDRPRDPVRISGSLKRAMLGPYFKIEDEEWEATTQALAETLISASMVMIEDGAN